MKFGGMTPIIPSWYRKREIKIYATINLHIVLYWCETWSHIEVRTDREYLRTRYF
jgi:hypothetical protein